MNNKNDSQAKRKLRFNPWIFLAIAFLLLITAWGTFILIAMRHTPERVDIVRPAR